MRVEPYYSFTAEGETVWFNLGLVAVWHAIHDGDDLGAYSTAEDAAWALANGGCPLPWAWRRLGVALPERLDRWDLRSMTTHSDTEADVQQQASQARLSTRSF